jgi:hypothetical protein
MDALDVATALAFLAGAGLALAAALAARAHRSFWWASAAGLLLLAVDKPLTLVDHAHEGLHRAGFADPPGLTGLDDLILLAAMLLALGLCAWHWRLLASDRWLLTGIASSGSLFAGAWAHDAFTKNDTTGDPIEQAAELAAACVLAVTFGIVAGGWRPRFRRPDATGPAAYHGASWAKPRR